MIDTYGVNEDRTVCVALITKGASTSMGEFFGEYVTAKEALGVPVRLAFPRDPYDRFLSFFWHMYTEIKDSAYNATEFIPADVMCTESVLEEGLEANFKRYTSHILTAEPNAHWAPQIPQLILGGAMVPNTLHKFSSLKIFWPGYFNRALHTEKQYKRLQVPKFRLSDLREYYTPDLMFGVTL